MKRKVSLPVVLGAALILCGLCVLAVFWVRTSVGVQQSRKISAVLQTRLPKRMQGVPEDYPTTKMPVLELDGTDWVALLELPAYGLSLPVADCWKGGTAVTVPTRFSGSCYDNTLVIGGADHPQQFGFCGKIQHGASVTVTDMTGAQFAYTVTEIDRAKQADAAWLTQADCDLTLFCRDASTMEYIAVRCMLAYR